MTLGSSAYAPASRALSNGDIRRRSVSRMSSAHGSLSNSIRTGVRARYGRCRRRVRPHRADDKAGSGRARRRPLQILRDRAALFVGAIEGEGLARSRMQPLQLTGDAKSRLVEMANLRLGHALADGLVNLPQLLFLLGDPSDKAGRTDQRRVEEIAQRLRGPILGDELLDVEIDRRRLDALAILGRRDHAFGKSRLRHAPAMRAAVNRGLMFRDPQRALGKVEHLPLLDPDRRPRLERPTAMAAGARRVPTTRSGSATCRSVPPL